MGHHGRDDHHGRDVCHGRDGHHGCDGRHGRDGHHGQDGHHGHYCHYDQVRTGQAKLAFKLDFPGNLFRAAFAILAMFLKKIVCVCWRTRQKNFWPKLEIWTNRRDALAGRGGLCGLSPSFTLLLIKV